MIHLFDENLQINPCYEYLLRVYIYKSHKTLPLQQKYFRIRFKNKKQ
jgi:hypothetical protein